MCIKIENVHTEEFDMRYFRFGNGEKTFVILPGLSIQSVMNSAEAVKKEYAVFEEEFTTYVFDRRENLPEVYTVRDMARDTAVAMKELKLNGVYLFGASQGGMMSQVIAAEYPELVKKVVLGSTASHIDGKNAKSLGGWIDLARAEDPVSLYLVFGESLYPKEVFEQYKEMLKTMGSTVSKEELQRFIILASGIKDFDVRDELKNIQCPVLVIGDETDKVVGADTSVEIAKILGENAELYMYDGYGHAAYDMAPDYQKRIYEFFIK